MYRAIIDRIIKKIISRFAFPEAIHFEIGQGYMVEIRGILEYGVKYFWSFFRNSDPDEGKDPRI
jgi:hypothetical protein